MEINIASELFGALAQKTRLMVFRQLMQAGTTGLRAGELSDTLDVPANTLSFHLSHLSNAGLVQSEKIGRSVIYRIDDTTVTNLLQFFVEDCCSLATRTVQHPDGLETIYSLRRLPSACEQSGDQS